MTKIICGLGISINIENTTLFKNGYLNKKSKRIQQYIDGITKFIELNNSTFFILIIE